MKITGENPFLKLEAFVKQVEYLAEIVATAIVLKQGVTGTPELKEKITEYMREKVAKYEVPKRIDFMDALPTSAVGKILKRELRGIMGKK